MTNSRTLLTWRACWAVVGLLSLLASSACTNPVAVPDSVIVATHTTSSGNHTTSSGNASTSERSRAP